MTTQTQAAKTAAPAIYAYDRQTGEYRPNAAATCQWSPRENKWLIPGSATTIEPPTAGEHEAAVWDKASGAWAIKPDHRGEVWYDTATKERKEIKELGAEPESTWTQSEPADSAAEWDAEAGAWVVPFATQRDRKRAGIWAAGDAILSQVKANYTQAEIESWSKQEQGAKDIAAGNTDTEAAQFVASIAAGRGIETATLVEKILGNVASYGALSAAVIGEQQRLDDLIKAATTTAELEAIVWTLDPFAEA